MTATELPTAKTQTTTTTAPRMKRIPTTTAMANPTRKRPKKRLSPKKSLLKKSLRRKSQKKKSPQRKRIRVTMTTGWLAFTITTTSQSSRPGQVGQLLVRQRL